MGAQMTFKRYELKYMLTPCQKQAVLEAMAPYMSLDEYGRTGIRNIYFDTDTYRLIRHSIEKPTYKEKLRLRSYQPAGAEDPVFVELKKKYRSVVYKRRLVLAEGQAMDCLCAGRPLPLHSQIAAEIDYFCRYYGPLRPAVFLSYEREAYAAADHSGLRITFDDHIFFRQQDFSFDSGVYGTPLLAPGATLMEVKTSGGLPLWLVHCLSRERIYKTSFSKYGTAYERMLQERREGGALHA